MKKEKQKKHTRLHNKENSQNNRATKKQKWILINRQGRLSGILDHSDFDTREKAKSWFQRTSDISGGTINIDEFYYVLKSEEYEFLKELDVLDIIADDYMN